MTRARQPSVFAGDLHRLYDLKLGERRTSAWARAGFWLFNSEFHCTACYRYGQFADRLRARNRVLGGIVVATHRLWNRWITHIHHTEIHPGADIGPGMLLMHRYSVVIGPSVIGSNCVIHQNVTIGQRVAGGDQGVPRIGDNVWIGPGAIITGAISVGNGVTISAGTVLSKDVPDSCLVAGNPGRVIARDYDNNAILNLPEPPIEN